MVVSLIREGRDLHGRAVGLSTMGPCSIPGEGNYCSAFRHLADGFSTNDVQWICRYVSLKVHCVISSPD